MEATKVPVFVEVRSTLDQGLALLEAGDYNQAFTEFEKMMDKGESAEVYIQYRQDTH